VIKRAGDGVTFLLKCRFWKLFTDRLCFSRGQTSCAGYRISICSSNCAQGYRPCQFSGGKFNATEISLSILSSIKFQSMSKNLILINTNGMKGDNPKRKIDGDQKDSN
jgi:hypothetical protein